MMITTTTTMAHNIFRTTDKQPCGPASLMTLLLWGSRTYCAGPVPEDLLYTFFAAFAAAFAARAAAKP
jgi:hypothetical protein